MKPTLLTGSVAAGQRSAEKYDREVSERIAEWYRERHAERIAQGIRPRIPLALVLDCHDQGLMAAVSERVLMASVRSEDAPSPAGAESEASDE